MSKVENTIAFSDISVYAEATPKSGSPFELEVSAFTMSFPENGIPRARLQLALGEAPQPGGGVRRAKAHLRAKDLERRAPITVYARFKGNQAIRRRNGSTVREGWEQDGEFTLFIGYLSKPAYSMGVGAASLTLEVDHWLVDLAATCKLSYLVSPVSAANFTRPAVITSFSGGRAAYDGDTTLEEFEGYTDIWGTLQRIFRFATERDRIDAKEIEFGNTLAVKNEIAQRALDRMDRGKKTSIMGLNNSAAELMRNNVNRTLSAMALHKETGLTFWETLISIGRDFMFSVIPTIYTATCAPVLKASGQLLTTVRPSEYNQLSLGDNVQSLPIRTLGLYQISNWFTLLATSPTDPAYKIEKSLIGHWDFGRGAGADIDTREGQTMLLQTPPWMSYSSTFPAVKAKSMPRNGMARSMSNTKRAGQQADGPSPAEQAKQAYETSDPGSTGNQLARAKLNDVLWQDRRGTIQGRLRFDIAPGSPIKVEVVGKNAPYYSEDNDLYAHVYQVDVTIDATQPFAGTTLYLSHLRTEAEQTNFGDPENGIVMDRHPLYNAVWDGTSLLDGA